MKNVRYDTVGKLTAMAWADNYVMVRRPGCIPFVMTMKVWDALSAAPC